jgi:hypothetical protein
MDDDDPVAQADTTGSGQSMPVPDSRVLRVDGRLNAYPSCPSSLQSVVAAT